MKIKRIIFMFLFSLLVMTVECKSYATGIDDLTKPLVIRLGSDYTDFIKVNGFTILTNTINVNVEGEYKVVYQNNTTFEEYTKQVFVTDCDSYYFDKTYGHYKEEGYSYTLIDTVMINNKAHTLMKFTGGRFKTNNYVLANKNSNTTIRLNTKLEMIDIESNNAEAFMVGNGYNDMNNDPDIHYAVYNKNVEFKKIVSTDPEYSTCIEGNDRYVFIGGYTDKETDLFPNVKSKVDAFLLIIDRNNDEIINKKLFSTKENDYLVDIKINGNYLYAILENETNDFKVLKLDIFGNVLKEKVYSFDYGFNCPQLKVIDNKVYLNYYYYDYKYLDDCEAIELIDEDLNSTIVYFNYSRNLILKDYDIVDGKIFKIVYGYRNGSSGYVVKLIEENKVLLEKSVHTYLVPQRINGNHITFTYPDGILVNEFNTLIFKNKMKTVIDPRNDCDTIDNYDLLINGKKIKHSEKSNLNYNKKLFGTYYVHYYFEERFDYLYTNKINVLPFVGVEENKVYDLGVTIDGNAICRINGEKIELPFSINNVGVYKVELLGQNNASLEYNIEVKDLSLISNIGNTNENIDIKINKNQISSESSGSFTPNKEITRTKSNYFYMYLIPILTGCVGYVLIKRV